MMKRCSLLGRITLFLGMAVASVVQAMAAPFSIEADSRCKQWVDSVFAQMSQEDKMGQLVVAVFPAQADRQTKRLVRDLVKKRHIGGLQFRGGTAEEQAILTNLAQKDARIPVMVLPAGKRLADGLSDAPVFPTDEAMQCIADASLRAAFEQEAQREYRELGMADSCLVPAEAGEGPWLEDIVVTRNAQSELAKLQADLESGKLSAAELDEKCRRVLAYKYWVGLRSAQAPLQVSGMSYRIRSEAAQALAEKLKQSAVTVVSNYFDILPLTPVEGGIGVLSVGEAGRDSAFVAALRQEAGEVISLQLAGDADEATCAAMADRLQSFRRLIVNITETGGYAFLRQSAIDFLLKLRVQAPVVYVMFAPQYPLLALEPAVARSSALVLAHSADPGLQKYVADVLFAKASANGRLAMGVGQTFSAGTGCDIRPGMKPGRLIPEDYGMKSYILRKVDDWAQKGVDEAAYPGCRVLVMKNGQVVYDEGFGTHSTLDTTAVRSTDLFDLADLTKPMATVLAVMKLYDEGRLKLDDKASAYLPVLRRTDKQDITVRDLLLNEAGLAPHIRFYMDAIDPRSVHGPYAQSWVDEWHKTRISEHSYFCSDFAFKKGLVSSQETSAHTMQMAEGLWLNKSFKNTLLQSIAKSELGGRRYVDSDPGFILLQQIVEKLAGLPFDLYVAREFYAPMGLLRTQFRPLSKFGKDEIMPTAFNDFLRRQDLCGYVHNEAAACLGGVAGNAGLFSTATEVGKVFQMLLNGGEWNGKRFLSEATCRLFTSERSAVDRQGLGFDRPDVSNVLRSPCAASVPASVYGYAGFTGTAVWADPDNELVYVFLSNRLCPDVWNTKLADMKISKKIQELIYQSLED